MKNSIRTLKEGNIAKRILVLLMDAVIFGFVMFCLIAWCTVPIANAAFNYNGLQAQGANYQINSRLYICEEVDNDGNTRIIEPNQTKTMTDGDLKFTVIYDYSSEDPNFYKERIHYYYLCYKTGNNVMYPEGKNPEDYKAPDYNVEIDDGKGNKVLPSAFYTEEWFNEKFGSLNDVKSLKDAGYSATKDFYYSGYYSKLNSDITKIQAFIIFPPFALSFFVFFILIPILFKNGETLGKKFGHLGFVTKDGFSIKKRQIVLRQIALFIYVSLCSFVVGIGITSLATLGIGVLIYFIATLISKTKRSPFDYLCYTYLIDTKNSVWFDSQEEEERNEIELEEKMEKYRSHKEPDKHLIQVGTKIVDEEVLKEFEQAKTEKSKSKK